MKRILILSSVIVLVATATACPGADANTVNVTVTSDLFSKYVWRGQNLNDGAVFQPSVSAGLSGFTGAVWGSFDLTDENGNSNEFTEVDLSLDYSGTVPGIDALTFSAGTLHYRFPNTAFDPTTEVYVGVGLACLCSPTAKVYWDIDQINGAYLQLGAGHTFSKVVRLSEQISCDTVVGASVGIATASYNKGYFGVDKTALNDLTVSVGLPVAVGRWTVKPSINWATMLDDEIRDATLHSDSLWAGVSASYALGR